MSKDKALRERVAAYRAWVVSVTRNKFVEMSTADKFFWTEPFLTADGERGYMVVLSPVARFSLPTSDQGWMIRCYDYSDCALERRFARREDAEQVYDAINPRTQRKTLEGRGFKRA